MIARPTQNVLYSAQQKESGMETLRKEIKVVGWYTPVEMSSLDFCPAAAELMPVVFHL